MKKYLMTAATALVLGGLMTSCTKDTDLSGGTARSSQDVQKTYEEAFLTTFGRPVEGLDWGFGTGTTASTRAMTRSNPGETYPATHTYADGGANVNANQWADPDEDFGGWIVPDPLTEGQKLRVKMYFQANPNLAYEDPHFRHFFVQQVYKGKTATGSNSTEEVIAADGSSYTSDNMNHLTVGQSNMHINNFNSGTCSTNSTVLDNGGNVNSGPYHSDEIMLMVNIDDTSCFGYHDSGSSNQSDDSPNHNDKMALVSAAIIDAWAANNGNPGDAVVDKWNRSFMGFDLAIKEGAQAYATDNNGNVIYATYDQAPGQPRYVWDGQNVICMYEEIQKEDQWGNKWIEYGALKDEYKTIMNVGWLTTNENFYIAADKVTLGQTSSNLNAGKINEQDWNSIKDYVVFDDAYVEGAQNNKAKVLNLKRIKELIDVGYLPVNNKSLQEWVKVGKSDGYFSDWIVTLTEAQRITPTDPTDPIIPDIPVDPDASEVMVVAEDLSTYVSTDGKELADFDFNDVVFEVSKGNNGKVHIKLLAAGGTLPLTVGGAEGWTVDNHGEQVLAYEVHRLFKVSTGTMVNTNSTTNGATRDPVEFDIDYPEGVSPSNNIYEIANAIPIRVYREDLSSDTNEKKWIVIPKAQPVTSDSGSTITASKLCVDTDFRWCNERNHIDTKFHYIDSYGNNKGSRFRLYLNGELRGKWWKDDTRISGDN